MTFAEKLVAVRDMVEGLRVSVLEERMDPKEKSLMMDYLYGAYVRLNAAVNRCKEKR